MDRSQRRPPDVEEALSSMLWTPYERTPSDSSSDEDEKLNSKLKKSKTTFDYDNFHPNQYVPSSRKIQNYDNFTRFSYPYYGPIPTVQKCFTELPTYESLYHNITPVFSSISSLNGRLVHSFTDNFIAQPNEPRQSVPEATTAALLEIANSVSGFASNDATMSIVDPMHHHPHNPHNPQNLPNPHECSALMSSSVVGPVSSLTAQLHGERNSFGIHKSLGQTDNAGDPLSSMHHDTNNNRNGANDSIGDDDDDDDEPDECDDEDEGYSDPDRVDEDTQPDQSQKKRPQTSVINNNDQIDLAREETRVTKLRFQVEKPPHTTSHGVSFECSRFTNSGSALTQLHSRRQFDERGTSQKYCARSAQTDLNLIGVSVTTTTTANTTGETETRISSMRVVDGVESLFIRAQNEPQLSFLNRGIRSNVAGKQDGPSSYGGGNGNGNGNENENINRSKGFGTFVVNVRNTLLAMRLNVPAAVAGKDPTNSNIPTTATTTTSVFLPISETLVNGQRTLSTSSPELMASLLPSSNPSTRTILGAILPPQPSLTIHVNQNENNSDLIKDVNDFSVNVNNSILQHSKWHDQQKSVVTPTTGISVVNCYSSVPNVNSINSVNNNNNYNNINNNYNNNNNVSNVITRTTATATVSTQATASGTIATTTTNATNTANVANVVNEGSANVVNNNLNNNNLTNVNNATIQTPSSSSSSSSSFLSPSSSGATNQNGNVAKMPVTRTFTSTESQTDDLHIDVITNSINNNNLSDIPTSPVGASSNNDPGNSPGNRNTEIIMNQTLSPGLIQSQTEALLSREQRRRERRERRHARNRHPHIMPPPVPPPQVMRPMLPDILHSHFPPPYTALTLTNPPPPASSLITPVISTVPIATAVNDGRFTFPLPVIRRSPSERSGKGCCGQWFAGPPLRALIAVVALGGVACALGGAALGATGLGGPPTSHLTAALLMIGVGVILVTVSGAAWRMTAPGGPPCLGLGSTVDLGRCGRRPCSSRGAPHGLLYPEFQHRPPPPSYQASMQEYRLRLLLLDRDRQNGVVRGGSPPPTYRSHAGSLLRAPLSTTNRGGNSSSIGGPGSEYSLPPSYRSRNTLTNNSSHSNENTNNRNTNNTNSSRSQNVSGDEALESQENSNNETTLLSKVEATILAQRSSTHATNITSPSASTTIGQSSSTPVKMTTSNSTAIKIKTDNSSYNNTSGSNVNSNNSSSAKNNNNNSSGYCKNGGNRRPTAGAILHHNPESQSQNYNEKFNPRVITNSNYHNNNSISNSVSCNNNSSTSSLSSTNHMNNNYNNNNNKIQNVTNSDTFVIEESENLQCSSLNKNATNIMNNNNCNFSNNTSNRKELVTIVTISSSQGPEQSQSEMEILAHL